MYVNQNRICIYNYLATFFDKTISRFSSTWKSNVRWVKYLVRKANNTLNVTDAGQALMDCGESYHQLAEIKYSLEDTVRQNFIEPLLHLQSKDLKEVNVHWILYISIKFMHHFGKTILM